MNEAKCYLRCVQNTHEPLLLEDEVEVTFGRGPDTKIKDSRCSRTQIKLKASYANKSVKITQIGRNSCGLNGMALKKNMCVTAKHGDRIEILLGQFIHVIEFQPQPVNSVIEKDLLRNKEKQKRLASPDGSDKSDGVVEISDVEQPLPKRTRLDVSGRWEAVDGGKLLVFTSNSIKSSSLIAAYDLDGTLICTVSGNVFPKNAHDWKFLNQKVLSKLNELHDQSYKIVVFTNQGGLSSGKQTVNSFKGKIEDIVKKINLPIQVFVATDQSIYRKPAIGMWEAALDRNDNIKVDMAKSFYCGDAAGRVRPELKKKDFSYCDLLFAKNAELNFVTPEHHFLKAKMDPLKISIFDPKTIPCDVPLCEPSWGQVLSNKLEVIILVGSPGSGKTHFAKTHLIPSGYVHINRDTLGTWAKCVNAMTTALGKKQKVVIDNTNPNSESRKRFIEIAKNYTSVVRCFIMKTSLQHSKHNNRFRLLTDPSHAVTDVVIHTYASKYEEPTLAEGFTEILKINFWPTFKNSDHEKLYKMFLLDK